ncbi:hypothetical protein EWH99_09865 [Sporolactobacillus sp. THM7-7]|nr:hypothetical protein EWH99_09865 [Sporolactobacillus sp. THM7-7]
MVIIIGSVILFFILINQLREKPLTGTLYRQPLALLMFSGYALFQHPSITTGDWCMIGMSLCLSFGLGMFQGRYTPLTHHNGAWYLSGSIIAVLVWAFSIPLRYLLSYISVHVLFLTPALNGSSGFIFYFISISGFLLGRYTMLLFRYPQLVTKVGENERKLRRLRDAHEKFPTGQRSI